MNTLPHFKPRILYKYRTWNNEYHQENLRDFTIYFSSPEDFNDPFDSAIPIKYTKETLRRHLNEYLKYSQPDLRQSQRTSKINRFMRHKGSWPEFDKWLDQQQVGIFSKTVGIFSLTSKPKNILMWSHYAEDHKGLLIGFNIQKFESFLYEQYRKIGEATGKYFLLRKVRYVREYPLFDKSKMKGEDFVRPLLAKSRLWAYEKEWRAIMHTRELREIPIDERKFSIRPNIIECISFGIKMSDDHKAEIIELVKQNDLDINLYQMKMKESEFGLDCVRINY